MSLTLTLRRTSSSVFRARVVLPRRCIVLRTMSSSAGDDGVVHIRGDRVKCVLESSYELGEGAIWHAKRGVYMHVDIFGCAVYTHDTTSGARRKYDMPSYVGTVVPRSNGHAVVALRTGLAWLDLDSGAVELFATPEADKPDNRFNDGKCGPDGRFWAGTMTAHPPRAVSGALYCLHSDGRLQKAFDGVTISNGIAWSLDGTVMYYIDTVLERVDAFDYDVATGALANRRVAFTIPDPEVVGRPDGSTIDADGNLWVAQWGGSRAVCYDVKTGKQRIVVHLPTGRVSSVAFGGPELADLYITTAKEGMSEEERAADPNAGHTFIVHNIGPKGIPAFEYAG